MSTTLYEKPLFTESQLKIRIISNSECKNAKFLCLKAGKDISKQSGSFRAQLLFSFDAHKLKGRWARPKVDQQGFELEGGEI